MISSHTTLREVDDVHFPSSPAWLKIWGGMPYSDEVGCQRLFTILIHRCVDINNYEYMQYKIHIK